MTAGRLSSRTVAELDAGVRRPRYDRESADVGVVRLGVGAFMRSHVAVYCDDAMEAQGGDWAIAGVSLRRPAVRDRLEPQDGLYVVGEFDAQGETRRLIGALKTVEELLARFENPALQHRTRQIAMDGSQKLPQRLLNTIRAQLERDGPIDALSLAVAGWVRYALARDESGTPYKVDDPLADRFARVTAETPEDPAALTNAFLAIREIFGADLPASPRFRTAVTAHLGNLLKNGVATTVGARPAGDAR